MRIAIFHNLPKGGALRVVNEQIKFLSKNHQVSVFTIDLKKFPSKSIRNFRLLKDFDNFVNLNFHHKSLAKTIDAKNFDIVLVHPDKLTQAPYLLRHLKTPCIYFCEELLRICYEKELEFVDDVGIFKKIYEQVTRKLRKQIDKDNAKSATRIVVASNYIKLKVKKAYGVEAFVCSLGVDTKVFKQNTNTSKLKLNQLLFIGEQNHINGFDFAKQVSVQMGIPLKVVYGWKLSDKQMVQQYSNSIAILSTSYNEPFGLVPLEVQSAGGIVLAVNEGGYKETIVNNKTGFLLPRNTNAFVNKIKWLLKNNNKAKKLILEARQHIIKNYTWEIHGKCLEKLLKLQ